MAKDKDRVLLDAVNLYNQGKLKECITTLNKVSFISFDLKELEYENNRLLCQLKMNQASKLTETGHLGVTFQEYFEKVQGLPCNLDTFSLVISVGLNYSFLLLSCHLSKNMIDSHFQAGRILTKNILQVAEVYGIPVQPNMLRENATPFSLNVLNDVLGIVENLLSQPVPLDLMMLNCYVLAVLWISQHQVNEGFKLLIMLKHHLERFNEIKTTLQNTIIVDPSIAKQQFPLCLLESSCEQGYCLNSSVIIVMALITKFVHSDKEKALALLEEHNDSSSFHIHYFKGLIFYEEKKLEESLQSFFKCLNMADSIKSSAAASLCMAGCCLAEMGKPNMAIAKFKEALSCDFDYLDALFYIAQQQQKLGKHDVEIQSLHYLKEALSARIKSDDLAITSTSLLQGPFSFFVHELFGKTISPEYANYWLGKRCLQLHRFSEASDALTDVIGVVASNESCFKALHINRALPSRMVLYRDCAFAMLKANKVKECRIICDYVIKGFGDFNYLTETKNRDKKRLREPTGETRNALLQLMCYKALAVLNLGQPLVSLQILQRVFNHVENSLRSPSEDKQLDSRKRRKLASGDYGVDVIDNVLEDNFHRKNDENSSLFKIKSQAHMIHASVLQNLDDEKGSLEEFYQGFIFNPDNIAAAYNYTKLLFKFGSKEIAASNWIKYKEFLQKVETVRTATSSAKQGDLPFLFEITDKEIQDLDDMAIKLR